MADEKTKAQEVEEIITAFATAVKKIGVAGEVRTAIVNVVGEIDDNTLDILSDSTAATDDDIKEALKDLKIPVALFRKNINILRGPKVEEAARMGGAEKILGSDLLPPVPDDESFINMLKTKGELRPGITDMDIVAVCKAVNANSIDLFELPDKIANRMEVVAKRAKKPFSETYYALEKMVLQRTHSDVLKAMGVERRHVSEPKRREFLAHAKATLWPALKGFFDDIDAWNDQYKDLLSDPRIMFAAFKGQTLDEYPDTGPVHDAAEAVNDAHNDTFSGSGIPNARYIAADAYDIKKTLADERLPQAVGAVDYEDMLEQLDVTVTASILRREHDIVKFALGIRGLKDVAPGDNEINYIRALWQFGRRIPWDALMDDAGSNSGSSKSGKTSIHSKY